MKSVRGRKTERFLTNDCRNTGWAGWKERLESCDTVLESHDQIMWSHDQVTWPADLCWSRRGPVPWVVTATQTERTSETETQTTQFMDFVYTANNIWDLHLATTNIHCFHNSMHILQRFPVILSPSLSHPSISPVIGSLWGAVVEAVSSEEAGGRCPVWTDDLNCGHSAPGPGNTYSKHHTHTIAVGVCTMHLYTVHYGKFYFCIFCIVIPHKQNERTQTAYTYIHISNYIQRALTYTPKPMIIIRV